MNHTTIATKLLAEEFMELRGLVQKLATSDNEVLIKIDFIDQKIGKIESLLDI